ncbi:hypothetical protein V8E51_015822 [Hyaloscypha variabilis]
MPSSPLLALPLELRTQIYTYVLTAPKGRIELVKASSRSSDGVVRYKILSPTSDGGCAILLSFLRTCKQIHAETHNLLWKHNKLHLSSVLSPPREGVIPPLPPSITTNIRSLALEIDPTFHKTLSSHLLFTHNLSLLTSWIHSGSLTSLTLICTSVSSRAHLTPRQLEKLIHHRLHPVHKLTYYEYLDALKLGTDPKSALSTINRKFVIDTGPGTPSSPSLSYQSLRPRPLAGNPMPMLGEIARAWGGQLQVNDRLAFWDGEGVEDVFLVQEEEEGEEEGKKKKKKWFFRDEVDFWLASENVKEFEEENGDYEEELYMRGYLAGLERRERRDFCRWGYQNAIEWRRDEYGFRRIEGSEDEGGVGG